MNSCPQIIDHKKATENFCNNYKAGILQAFHCPLNQHTTLFNCFIGDLKAFSAICLCFRNSTNHVSSLKLWKERTWIQNDWKWIFRILFYGAMEDEHIKKRSMATHGDFLNAFFQYFPVVAAGFAEKATPNIMTPRFISLI